MNKSFVELIIFCLYIYLYKKKRNRTKFLVPEPVAMSSAVAPSRFTLLGSADRSYIKPNLGICEEKKQSGNSKKIGMIFGQSLKNISIFILNLQLFLILGFVGVKRFRRPRRALVFSDFFFLGGGLELKF